MPTLDDPFMQQMLESLIYPNPPAGIAAILVNVGGDVPIVIHVDMHDTEKRVLTFDQGTVSFTSATEPVMSLVSPHNSLQPKVPVTAEEIVRANSKIMSLLHDGAKIQAIKEVRALLGTGGSLPMGLREALNLVDEIQKHGLGARP